MKNKGWEETGLGQTQDGGIILWRNRQVVCVPKSKFPEQPEVEPSSSAMYETQWKSIPFSSTAGPPRGWQPALLTVTILA